MKAVACLLLALAALACVAAQQPAAAPAGRFCHQSCYTGTGVTCEGALKVKKQLLKDSGVPVTIEKTACNYADCTAFIRYSFSSETVHGVYQGKEKTDPKLVATYKAGGLTSAAPKGLLKSGPCATLKA